MWKEMQGKEIFGTTHEGIWYTCDHCENKVIQKGNIKVHIESKHEGIWYTCDHCEYKVIQKGNIKVHIGTWYFVYL